MAPQFDATVVQDEFDYEALQPLVAVADEEEGGHKGIHHLRKTRPDLLQADYVFNEGAYGFSQFLGKKVAMFGLGPSEKSPCWVKLVALGGLVAIATNEPFDQAGPNGWCHVDRLTVEVDLPQGFLGRSVGEANSSDRETQSHRGWEIREPQFTVVADTNAADARWAAQHVSEAWKNAAALADRFTTAHHHPDFGLNQLQVVISNEPLRDRDAPLTTVNVVGLQTQVQINVAPGQPSLQRQASRMREGAAFAMLHAAGVDSAAPPWVLAGLAAVAGRSGMPEDQWKALAGEPAIRFGGQQWRYTRGAQDTLNVPDLDHEEAALRMTFLLKGNDAAYAPALFAALRQANATAIEGAAVGKTFRPFPGDPQPAETGTTVDFLKDSLNEQFVAWKANPQAGEPVFVPTTNATNELVALEREMLVLLKMARRLGLEEQAASATTEAAGSKSTSIDRGVAKTKIITFDRAKNAATSEPHSVAKPAQSQTFSFATLAEKLLNSPEPWGTLDSDGRILLSTDVARLQQLLGPPETYAFDGSSGRAVLARKLETGKTLRGWLEENPKDKSRPLAKFELVGAFSKGKILLSPQAERNARGTTTTR